MALAIVSALLLGSLLIATAFLNWVSGFRKTSRIVSRVYVALSTRHNSAYRNRKELFLLTGIIATTIRSRKNPVSLDSIAAEVVFSAESILEPSAHLPRIRGYEQAEREQRKELLNFIFHFELLKYRVDRPNMDSKILIPLIQKHAYEIEYVMVQTLRKSVVTRSFETRVQGLLSKLNRSELDRVLSDHT